MAKKDKFPKMQSYGTLANLIRSSDWPTERYDATHILFSLRNGYHIRVRFDNKCYPKQIRVIGPPDGEDTHMWFINDDEMTWLQRRDMRWIIRQVLKRINEHKQRDYLYADEVVNKILNTPGLSTFTRGNGLLIPPPPKDWNVNPVDTNVTAG